MELRLKAGERARFAGWHLKLSKNPMNLTMQHTSVSAARPINEQPFWLKDAQACAGAMGFGVWPAEYPLQPSEAKGDKGVFARTMEVLASEGAVQKSVMTNATDVTADCASGPRAALERVAFNRFYILRP